MMLRVGPSKLQGTVEVPPSKSVAQRLIAAAALSPGASMIRGIGDCDDVTAALGAVAGLGRAHHGIRGKTSPPYAGG
jgi:3-phosphoshikimate 1-carboxyvinyltransferase